MGFAAFLNARNSDKENFSSSLQLLNSNLFSFSLIIFCAVASKMLCAIIISMQN